MTDNEYSEDIIATHDFSRDPMNAIIGKYGIFSAIRQLFDSQCYGAAIIIIFAGIDAMANLDRPQDRVENDPDDFKQWVSKYIDLPGQYKLTPDDWWGARNAIIHTYGAYSKAVRQGKAKLVFWMIGGRLAVWYRPDVDPNAIFVDAEAFRDAFFDGVNRFITQSFADKDKRPLIEERLRGLILTMPFKEGGVNKNGDE